MLIRDSYALSSRRDDPRLVLFGSLVGVGRGRRCVRIHMGRWHVVMGYDVVMFLRNIVMWGLSVGMRAGGIQVLNCLIYMRWHILKSPPSTFLVSYPACRLLTRAARSDHTPVVFEFP